MFMLWDYRAGTILFVWNKIRNSNVNNSGYDITVRVTGESLTDGVDVWIENGQYESTIFWWQSKIFTAPNRSKIFFNR
jgi:hypothetical protein